MAMVIANSLFREFISDDEWWGKDGYYTGGDIKFDDANQTVEFSCGIINAGFHMGMFETLETFFEKWLEARNGNNKNM